MAECSNCQFQNMPGVTHCGRCGASLTLRTAVINVHPPRANRWAKTWRRTIMARFMRSSRESVQFAKRQWEFSPSMELPSLGLLCRLSVPGWAQIHSGQATFGKGLLAGYAVLIAAAAACFGSSACSFLLGMAFTCHGISVYEVARRSSAGFRDRVFRVLLGCGLLGAVVYLPVYSVTTRFVDAVVIQQNRYPLQAGDVLLVRRFSHSRSTPRVGDVVQYQIATDSVLGHTSAGAAARYLIQGARMDRVLAGPGQVITWENGQLTVDGQRSPWRPLNPGGALQSLSVTLPSDSWFILPSTDIVTAQFQPTQENWEMWSIVKTSQIEGRIVWRSWPWSRIGFVDD
jgi:hypothetical protein